MTFRIVCTETFSTYYRKCGDHIKQYQKFDRFKTVFAVFFTVLLLSSVLGATVCKKGGDAAELFIAVSELHSELSFSALNECILLLSAFIAGPTVYAPVSSFFSVSVCGILFGVKITESLGGVPEVMTEIFFSALISYVSVIYASFVTLTGLGIFTHEKTNNKRELFDGVMFRAEKFRGIFNIRFVLSYIAFFLLFLIAVCILSVFKDLLLSVF